MTDGETFELSIENNGERHTQSVELGKVEIGRDADAGVQLDHESVSRHHARLFREDFEVFLEDMRSANGSWINGKRVAGRERVYAGDVIRIGEIELRLRGDSLGRREDEETVLASADELAASRRARHDKSAERPGERSPAPADLDETPVPGRPKAGLDRTVIVERSSGRSPSERTVVTQQRPEPGVRRVMPKGKLERPARGVRGSLIAMGAALVIVAVVLMVLLIAR